MVGKPLAFDDAYKAIKHAVMNGMFLPGHRIDSTRLQKLVGMSNTPIREVLRRLSAEGLVIAHAREGFYIPLLTEPGLSGFYDWLTHVTLFAAQLGAPTRAETHPQIDFATIKGMAIVEATAAFFLGVGVASGNDEAEAELRRANDRLYLVRTLEESLLHDREGELHALMDTWTNGTFEAFEEALRSYFLRRRAIAYKVVRLVHRYSL